MADTNSRARHRAATKPLTALDDLKDIDTRKGLVAVATTGLALGTLWAGSAIAAPEGADTAKAAGPVSAQVGNAVAKAHLAVAANPEIVAPEEVGWSASQLEVPSTEAEETTDTTTATQNAPARQSNRSAAAANRVSVGMGSVSIPANIAGGSIADIALRYQGIPYVYGGTTPRGFDCSGFVGYVYSQAGIGLPRTSWAQGASGTKVSAGEAKAGDIVYYGNHVGIYLGEGKMVHSPKPGESVRVVDIYGSPSFVRVANQAADTPDVSAP